MHVFEVVRSEKILVESLFSITVLQHITGDENTY